MTLTPFFKPQGVVVIGASTSPEKLGYGVARNLVHSGYQGAIHFLSQKPGTLFERPLYTDLAQVPDPVDLAILIVPPQSTPQTIADCAKRGIHAVTIVSAGFREAGAEGAALEQECLTIASAHGVRLLGPNCIGTLDTHLPLDTTFLQPPMPAPGHIGFISHSGAFCAAIIDWARAQGFGFSQLVSLGNQADVNETEMLPILAQDEHTRVIVLYMESVSDGRKFVEAARAVTQHKPVIALKVGCFESGQKAAASHTGALAASDIAFDAAFDKAGILRAESAEQMFDWARALENCPLPRGRNIAIITNAGGPGVIAADALEHHGLTLAQLHEPTLKALIATLPSAASVFNPVDMLASASPEQYASCLKIFLEDNNVDGVLVILPPPPMFKAEDVAEKIVDVLESSSSSYSQGMLLADSSLSAKPEASFGTPESKPVVIALMGSTLVEEAAKTFQLANIPTYPFPERAASALSALFKRAEFVNGVQRLPTLNRVVNSEVGRLLTPDELLANYKIPTAPIKLARNEDEAIAIAKELGFPVVMKIASPDILHKSDMGGVILNIKDAQSLSSAYTLMMKRVQEAKPEARIEGVHLQRQIAQGQEVIVGMVRDPQFGALMMFGSGGVEVEGLKDVAFALAPLNQVEAEKMIRKTWAGRKLKGFRNIPAADEESVIDVLIKLSWLAFENEFIEELEINPLRVLSKGAVAVDVRMRRKGD